ncbi:glycoside hydrolase family 72 protein [Hyaloscypha variabilis F]|uniref:1,3-beta-glucanosyltransferase n=1 Tax=Hyaloscypha variabilis (strain UAMH 11265 / GT02V1 / F) TaxID=1149755 RepID=A0A2J6SE75_HYAVF|nr:glycoside hydrolase family 72 protein [Hyaloscypha variabilis F]
MFTSLIGATLAACFARAVLAIPTITVDGAKFFAGGEQFFIKGSVAYQGTPGDPLIDAYQCGLDATSMAAIGANSIRVYHIDPYSAHDGCMKAFSDAGIYVWLDLDTFNTTIEQTDPAWTEESFLAFTEVMDVFQVYDNLAGFWIGNEVINTDTGSLAAPYVKAATADMKSYMAEKKYRAIPIGYSAADIASLRPMLQNYLACGSEPNQIIDFYGLNSYEWCGAATYDSSGYSNLQAMSEGYNIPIFFSETGCNVGGERTFDDQAAIFGPDMVGTWSGSIVYEWVEETNDYGLVSYPNGGIYDGPPTPIQPDYDNLSGQWKTLSPTGVALTAYTPSNSPPPCPTPTLGWQVSGDVPLPTLDPSFVAAAASAIKPTATPRATTSSANPGGSTGTVPSFSLLSSTSCTTTADSISATALSLGLQHYYLPYRSGSKKLSSTSSTDFDLGTVAASSPLFPLPFSLVTPPNPILAHPFPSSRIHEPLRTH